MTKLPTVILWSALFAIPTFASQAQADPLRFDTGRLFLDNRPMGSFGVDFTFSGSGFEYTGEAEWSPVFLQGLYCTSCAPVRTEPVFRLQFSRTQVIGAVVQFGQPQLQVGWDGDLVFRAPSVAITGSDISEVPFTVTGTLTSFLEGSNVRVLERELSASGRLVISRDFAFYDFAASDAPVPEPTTLVLFGGGVLALAVRRRKGVR